MMLRLHHRLMLRGYLAYSRFTRGMTLGVRAVLLRNEQVVLVKHTYVPGWSLPGGGVERGESLGEALEREVREEVGAVLTGPPRLFAIYRNSGVHRGDHVALYVCRDWSQRESPRAPNLEIAACDLFPLSDLPADATPATSARIREVVGGAPPASDW
jgi:ADP-ribose pyrophosphatase YjhB (NUDIX family)